ncbi:alpha/beta fold hydrolase [Ferrovibrio sp.]|uniref:alpha/beta hydrolase n=1 Tax=Ferrovibrio sp. TaxID=1917215 RepID=UPI002632EC74|nr:alpha/beta fold hydrolase [Ferrovibrio sp.]
MGADFTPVRRAAHHLPQPDEPELRIHVRECRPAEPGRPAGAILFVHGATFASAIWDIGLPGMSFLERAAQVGMAAYALDVRGYADSPSQAMAKAAAPYARAQQAVRDIDLVADFIRSREGCERILLVGGSWGTITGGCYAAGAGKGKLSGLVLHAPIFAETNSGWLDLIADPGNRQRPNPALGAFRQVTEAEARIRWDAEIPEGSVAQFRDETVLAAMMRDEIAAGLPPGADVPSALRVPNGALLDLFEAYSLRPLYDPADITMPTLLLRGSRDTTSTRSDALALFDRLGTRVKRYVEISHGTHFIGAERQAWQVQEAVLAFAGSIFLARAAAF